ncbi:uncharacterized protein CIMG_11038 [Coccidioides immitis RS]|uniref:Uncharacterized protein n=2 Tax=Coccidioides immitis TaxID=5501 RepID=A0A0D8JYU4_COCIM|nr:uncharacterized protein CIMG_11038 [Coccidioides immitis RS]KJF61433.1 hypothetical protein CIMG_11038 [Coccidioides immitis RS]KMP07163.1 hypothetical protein CIRG_06845 [Coccidioides immitis RMSCC 2394]
MVGYPTILIQIFTIQRRPAQPHVGSQPVPTLRGPSVRIASAYLAGPELATPEGVISCEQTRGRDGVLASRTPSSGG